MATLIKTIKEIKNTLSKSNCEKPIGFVATMGALHAGHISLINAAKKECKTVVISIFVNPLQFSPNEDFNKYPRDLEGDLKICEENKVDYVFAPSEDELYPDEASKKNIIIPPKELTDILCGKSRPLFFQGVATVVYKLLNIIQCDFSYWGEKDLQQSHVIQWLVKEFKLPLTIRVCSTVREPNGLACSSRNKYLTKEQIEIASNIYKSLLHAKQNIRSGIFSLSKAVIESLIFLSQVSGIKVEYFEARDKESLSKADDNKTHGFYYLTACKIGDIRLIDNIEIL